MTEGPAMIDDPVSAAVPLWVIDGNNVMGSAADGWWNDPAAAAARLAERVGRWARSTDALCSGRRQPGGAVCPPKGS